jgi:hypothetical protein
MGFGGVMFLTSKVLMGGGGGGGGGGIGVYKSADPPKFEAKSAIRAKILDKSAICYINKIRNPCKTFARSEIRAIFSVKSDDPKTYSPPPPPPPPIDSWANLIRVGMAGF